MRGLHTEALGETGHLERVMEDSSSEVQLEFPPHNRYFMVKHYVYVFQKNRDFEKY